jgi:lipoprotein-anchoring transpeptidase ErfK/SrfK
VPLPLRVNETAVRRYVDGLGRRFDQRPADARLVLRNLRPAIVGGRQGRALDRRHASTAILTALRRHERGPIVLQGTRTAPKVTAQSYGRIIVIRRGSNQLHLYHRARLLRSFPVATGERRYPTPLGRFSVVTKARHPWWYPPNSDWARGAKPIPPGPGNPLGTRWMGLSVSAVGIHGTPDAASIGYSVSHGCIRMRIADAEWLFERVPVGTPVFIVGA